MNFRNQCSKIVFCAGLAVAFAVTPATRAFSQNSASAKWTSISALQSHAGRVDINTATEGQLRAVPGIGSVYAKRIIAGRPYSTKGQVVSKGVLPQGVYNQIKDKIVAHRRKK